MKFLAAILFACSLASLHARPVPTGEKAIGLFREIARTELDEALQANKSYLSIKALFPKDLQALPSTSLELMKQIDDALAPIEKQKLILYGELRELAPDRSVWIVTGPNDRMKNFQACIDQETGKLLLLWIVPEG